MHPYFLYNLNAEFGVDLDAKYIVLCRFQLMEFDLNLATALPEDSRSTVKVKRHALFYIHPVPPTCTQTGKGPPSVYFSPGIIIFLCNEAVLLPSQRRNIACHGDCPRRDCTATHILEVTEEMIEAGISERKKNLEFPAISSLKQRSMKISL